LCHFRVGDKPLSQVTRDGLTRFYGCLWHASQRRRERISIWTSEQRQGLGDEVIVANVRELRAISHSDRKNDQVEADMEWMKNKPQERRLR
jgi:hypothetical protein